MDGKSSAYASIDDYIATFTPETREILQTLRGVIRESAPDATEKISYQMPTFALHGNLVHFAAYAKHIGFYPTSSGINAFQQELSAYKWSKGAVQFPIDKPLPYELISKIVRYRAAENREHAAARKSKKKQ